MPGSPVRATMWGQQTEEPTTMTEPLNPPTPDEPTSDETFTWTDDGGSTTSGSSDHTHDTTDGGSTGRAGQPGAAAGATATAILDSLREAVDDLAERATPTVREFSARAAELAAIAADRAAPLARRAGEVTSDASGKLATRSRIWAADLRASISPDDAPAAGPEGPASTTPTPPPVSEPETGPIDGPNPA
jgi:hypothetical protein